MPVSKTEANLFFGLISQLYESASVVITSNKGFDGWAELLGDAILTTASGVKDIKAENKEEYTGSRSDLIKEGYEPCGRCKP